MSIWSCVATSITHPRADLLNACKQSSTGTGREEILRGSTCCSSLAGSRLTSACMQPGSPCGSVSRCQRKKNKKEISASISVFLEFKKDNTCLFVWRCSKNHNLSVLFSSWSARLTIESHIWQPLSLLISGCTINAFDQLQQLWMKSHLAPFANDMSCWSVLCIFFFC